MNKHNVFINFRKRIKAIEDTITVAIVDTTEINRLLNIQSLTEVCKTFGISH